MLAPGGERIVGKNPPLDIIARDIIFGEGPVWDAHGKQLYFIDICGDTIWKWKPGGKPEAVLKPSNKANGMASTSRTGSSSRAGAGARCSASRRTARSTDAHGPNGKARS